MKQCRICSDLKIPADYRKLLTQCFVVVPENAPTFSGFDPHNRWPQLEVLSTNIAVCASVNVFSCGFMQLGEFISVLILAGKIMVMLVF